MANRSMIRATEATDAKTLRKSLKKGGGGGTQRIPEAGITVRFMTEPGDGWIEYYQHFMQDHAEPCVGRDNDCEGCAQGIRATKRVLVNAVDVTEGKVIAFEMPKSVAETMLKRYEKFGTVLDRDYDFSREGSGLDTTYDVTHESPSRMSMDRFKKLDLWALLESQVGDNADSDDEDDDDKPARTAGRRPAKKAATRPSARGGKSTIADDEDEDDVPVRSAVRRPAKKATATPAKATARKVARRRMS